MTLPAPGQHWEHYKGGLYIILAVARMEADLTPVVVYASDEDGQCWVRPLDNFLEITDYEIDNRKQPRFSLVQ